MCSEFFATFLLIQLFRSSPDSPSPWLFKLDLWKRQRSKQSCMRLINHCYNRKFWKWKEKRLQLLPIIERRKGRRGKWKKTGYSNKNGNFWYVCRIQRCWYRWHGALCAELDFIQYGTPDAERLLQEKRVASLASAYLTGFLSTVLHFHK